MRRSLPWIVGLALLAGIGLLVWATRSMTPAPESLSGTTTSPPTSETTEQDAAAGPPVARPDTAPPAPGHEAEAPITGDPVELAFEPFDLTAAQQSLTGLLAQARVEPDSTDARQLLQASQRLGLVESLGLGGLNHSRASERVVAAGVDVFTRYGQAGFASVGEEAWQQFLRALSARPADTSAAAPLALPRERAGTLAAALTTVAWTRTWLELTWLGGFLVLAEHEQLLDARGQIAPDQLPLVHLMFRWMWARRLEGSVPVERLLTAQEVVAMRRWQIERSSQPVEARLALAESVRPTLGAVYDVDRAIAVLQARRGALEAAGAALERSLARAKATGDTQRAAELRALRARLSP